MKFNPYLYKAFETFVAHKKRIIVNVHYLESHVKDEKLKGIFFHPIDRTSGGDIDGWINENQNLIKPSLSEAFQNVEQLVIVMDIGCSSDTSFALLSVLGVIQSTQIHEVIFRNNSLGTIKIIVIARIYFHSKSIQRDTI